MTQPPRRALPAQPEPPATGVPRRGSGSALTDSATGGATPRRLAPGDGRPESGPVAPGGHRPLRALAGPSESAASGRRVLPADDELPPWTASLDAGAPLRLHTPVPPPLVRPARLIPLDPQSAPSAEDARNVPVASATPAAGVAARRADAAPGDATAGTVRPPALPAHALGGATAAPLPTTAASLPAGLVVRPFPEADARVGPRHSAPRRRRPRWHVPTAAATLIAIAGVAALVLNSLPGTTAARGSLVATPSQVQPTTVSTTSSASPTTVTTQFAAGAFAAPQTGGVRLTPQVKGPLTGKVIVLDPGHNGGYKRSINEKNYYTFGAGYRPCAAYGTTTFTHVPEHTIAWQISNRVVPLLLAQGATVVLTRTDDTGYGPCNNERPEIANREGADFFLSIHVDGNDNADLRGFHITWSPRMAGGAAVSESSEKAATILRQVVLDMTEHPQSNYMQSNGISILARTDLSVLDGIRGAPALLIETGNSRNPEDVALLTSPAGQESMAKALAAAAIQIVTTLPSNPTAGPASASPSAPPGASIPPTTAQTPLWETPTITDPSEDGDGATPGMTPSP